MSKKILVLGGGTAGWLTALYCTKTFPQHEITVMESKSIGIVGVGEGSTPPLVDFLKLLGVDIDDLLKKTKGTIKQGISFENWNGDGKKYFHPFKARRNLKDSTSVTELSYNNIIDRENIYYSLHFDTNLLGEYFKSITQCKHYYDELRDIVTNEKGDIVKINGIECDFVFDCTGFRRKLIGEHYKSKWKDYKCLPIKKAIPFFLPPDNKPYTQAIAMKYGWVWKIPLQHRCGVGYLIDDDYINEEQAFAEAQQMFPGIEYTRTIEFKAGRYENVWINNCISIGLSSGFTEPLEATSIWLAVGQLQLLEHFMFSKNDKKEYNTIVANNNDSVMKFLYFHYMTHRRDSLFWQEFRQKNRLEGFVEKLKNIKQGNMEWVHPSKDNITCSFSLDSWWHVAKGLGLVDPINKS